ncbi:MAG: restriction endonuclease, partial [Chloroflexi bacterium]|nr:restriction endonuclease [Chloroflexota bacterium]
VLDSLRGSLHRFDAVRATIVSTGKFSKTAKAAAFDKGAAPITLIDGERLLDLLMEHDIGIRRREIRVFEFDPESLSEFEDDAVLPPSG